MELRVPGDKSISQRALILGSLADGVNRIRGILPRGDPASTRRALRELGIEIPALEPGEGDLRFAGHGLRGFRPAGRPVDLENSGTGARLLLGVLAGQPVEVVVTGDASLRRRPMGRITDPLTAMGARFEALETEGRLPMRVRGGSLSPLTYTLPMASAQVKSALLLAGLVGGVSVRLREPGHSRDHTERMLGALGVNVRTEAEAKGQTVSLVDPPSSLPPLITEVPGDFSSAAFLLLLGLLGPGTEPMMIRGVGVNPTRTGLLAVLERMGAHVHAEPSRGIEVVEPSADLVVEPGPLVGCEVGAGEIPGLIDEVPILVAGAVRAHGTTRITGARELRVKETDRIRALVENLRSLGVEVEELEDGLEMEGTDHPLRGSVHSFGDHRIAMAFGILGALPGNEIQVEGPEVAGVSFPGFWEMLGAIGREFEGRTQHRNKEDLIKHASTAIITLDGPAGSGKSTTAREVARRLGFQHLDSGALYRALTFALLDAGIDEEAWSDLSQEILDRFRIWLRPNGARFEVLLDDRVLGPELRSPEVTARVSPLSALPEVRRWLLETQRRAGERGRLVADGRDMGTVVFPDAELKVFLTANLEVRAKRRFLEREGRLPAEVELEEEQARIQARDRRDSGRSVAPLRRPEGALEIDTSDLTFEEQVAIIVEYAKELDWSLNRE